MLIIIYFLNGEKVAKSRCSIAARAFVQRKPHPWGTMNIRHPVGKELIFFISKAE